ncbi:type II 3-dehydroquinate dehydratase [Mariprofundus sp. EBB-1]|uniref:type II 3-dehydroquinate dehydratase n=1 Tax=Mariprofundus sp. EBB-1 TaxID=2650971 RepID=UPI000EF1E4CB|nr:type II 3-dehydroquinate dehydratase [Mariprofundus sp. EBB-1]RLL49757.1 type II 3-dehydroquinate dehydratase [Mariprofundus sp. EBB-1]
MNTLKILVLHGPNLNLLGTREPAHYGASTLHDINQQLTALAGTLHIDIDNYQSNHEGDLVDRIHQAVTDAVDGIVINPAAYTHTSIALRDALLAANIPFVEVHLSNVHKREAFRHKSMLADAAIGVVAGFGATSYTMALNGINQQLRNT